MDQRCLAALKKPAGFPAGFFTSKRIRRDAFALFCPKARSQAYRPTKLLRTDLMAGATDTGKGHEKGCSSDDTGAANNEWKPRWRGA